MSSEN